MIWDILTAILCTVALAASWLLYRRKRYFVAVCLLAVAGLTLRFFSAGDQYVHQWDERYHALVAKNMIEHPLKPTLYANPVIPYDYKDWSKNHIWVHKPPVPLWIMAGSMALFGINEIALRLPSILLTTLGIFLIFTIGKHFFDQRTGYLAAFFFAVNGLILDLAGGRIPTDHIDVMFLFFVELAVFFTVQFVRGGKTVFNVLAGVSIGLAVLTKWLPGLIVIPVWLLLVFDSGRFQTRTTIWQFLLLVATSVAVFFSWQIYIRHAFPLESIWESDMNRRHIFETLEHNGGGFLFYLDKIRINYGELVYIPMGWFIYRLFRDRRNLKLWALAVWLFIPLIFFSVIRTKMQGYILFTAPVLFIISAAFLYQISDRKYNPNYKMVVTVLLSLFIIFPLRYGIERSKLFVRNNRDPEWRMELKKLGAGIQNSKSILFNYSRPVEAMFYTDMTAYDMIPEPGTLAGLLKQGYRVIINDNGNLPAYLAEIEGIEYVKLK